MARGGRRRGSDPELYASAFLFALAGAASAGAWRLGLGDVHDPGPGFMPFAAAMLLTLMALGRLVHRAIGAAKPINADHSIVAAEPIDNQTITPAKPADLVPAMEAAGRIDTVPPAAADEPLHGAPSLGGGRWRLVTIVLATLFATGYLFERVGFSLATFAMLCVLFGVVARKRWWVALLWAVSVVAVARLVSGALGLPLPQGPFGL